MSKRLAGMAFEVVGWGLVYGVAVGSDFWSNVAAVYFWMLATMAVIAVLGSLPRERFEKLADEDKTIFDHAQWAISLGKFVVLTGLGWVSGGILLVMALLLRLMWWASSIEKSKE